MRLERKERHDKKYGIRVEELAVGQVVFTTPGAKKTCLGNYLSDG